MADSRMDLFTGLTPATAVGTDLLYVEADPAGTPADRKMTLDNLRIWTGGRTRIVEAAATKTAVVNRHYILDASGLGANAAYTLPASPAVGDTAEFSLAVAHATKAVTIVGNTGQTINNGSAASEWSRLIMPGESALLLCVATDTWIVLRDGRIPIIAASTVNGGTLSTTPLYPAWASRSVDNSGAYVDAANDYFLLRRPGNFLVGGALLSHVTSSGAVMLGDIMTDPNGTPAQQGPQIRSHAAAADRVGGQVGPRIVVATVDMQITTRWSISTGSGTFGNTSISIAEQF